MLHGKCIAESSLIHLFLVKIHVVVSTEQVSSPYACTRNRARFDLVRHEVS